MSHSDFFNSLDSVPVWTKTASGLVCTDMKTGKILQTQKNVLMPDGSTVGIFKHLKAVTVKDVEGIGDLPSHLHQYMKKSRFFIPSGVDIDIAMKPNGQFCFVDNPMQSGIYSDIQLSEFSIIGLASSKKIKP